MSTYLGKIEFLLNGDYKSLQFDTIAEISPTTTLLNYLRESEGLKGAKEGCGEGDCGACTVLFGEIIDDSISWLAVNSCLVLLPMIHGKSIITIEYYSSHNLHPVQQSIIDNNASQCGYCTPGIALSLISLSQTKKQIDKHEIGLYLSGNICRCTGYDSILNAGHEIIKQKQSNLIPFNDELHFKLLSGINSDTCIKLSNRNSEYYIPFSINDALNLKTKYPKALFLAGSSEISLAIQKKGFKPDTIIDITHISELQAIEDNIEYQLIGSVATINSVRDNLSYEFNELKNILQYFGSNQIRNLATIGGNIASASPIGDTLPILMAYNAIVVLKSKSNTREILLEDFITGYRKTTINDDEIISGVRLIKEQNKRIIKSYKISKRKDLDISTVNAAFSLSLNNNIVNQIFIYYGGMAGNVVRARDTEEFLKNKEWTIDIIQKARDILINEFNPISDARAEKEGRRVLSANLLLKFFNDSLECNE